MITTYVAGAVFVFAHMTVIGGWLYPWSRDGVFFAAVVYVVFGWTIILINWGLLTP